MMMPNFFYEIETGVQFFLGGVRQVNYNTSSELKEATRAATGKRQSVLSSKSPTETIECVFTDPNITAILENYLDYIKGKTLIFGDGARMLSSYVNVISADAITTPGDIYSKHCSFSIQYVGDVRGRMKAGLDISAPGYTPDDGAAGGTAAKLSTLWTGAQFSFSKNFLIPSGSYMIFARARDVAHISNDLVLAVADATSGSTIMTYTKTLATNYGFYFANFTLTSAQDNHNLFLQAVKGVSTPNTIYVDLLGFVAVP